MDILQDMLSQQHEINEDLYEYGGISNDKVLGLTRALIHEVVELEDELRWKWWEEFKLTDYKKAEEEFIDMWIFMLGIADKLGFDSTKIYEGFLKKSKTNMERLIREKSKL